MRVAIDIHKIVRSAISELYDNGKYFALDENSKVLVSELLRAKNLTEAEVDAVKSVIVDLTYALSFYAIGNVFKSVDKEAYTNPLYGFVQTYFMDTEPTYRKYIKVKTLIKILSLPADAPAAQYLSALSGDSTDKCVGMFLPFIRSLTQLIHNRLSYISDYNYKTVDFALDANCTTLILDLGKDIRAVLFEQLYPKGYYDGVGIGMDGKPRHDSDNDEFETYCVSNNEEALLKRRLSSGGNRSRD